MVIQIGALKSGRDADVRADIAAVVEVAHAVGAIVKVILENAYLTDDEKVRGCRLTEAAGADFVKTSTGFAPGGATHEDLRLMRANTSPRVQVKAAGGVRTLDALLGVMDLGVTRVGATATQTILDDFRARKAGRAPAGVSAASAVARLRPTTDDTVTSPPPALRVARLADRGASACDRLAETQADAIETAEPVVCRRDRRRRARPPVRDRPLADPGRGDVPALRLVPRLQPDRRAVDDVPHAGGRRQRPAPGDVHRADARTGRGDPVELRVRPERRDDRLLGERAPGGAGRDGPWRPAARPPGRSP